MRALLYLVFFLSLSFSAVAQEIKGDWKFPSDIAVANGKLYVVDGLNDRIAVYDLYGKHLADIKVKSPFGIAVKEGLIYVTSQKGELYVLDEFGNLEKSLKLRGRPIDVAVLKGKLFVSNGKDESVDVYTGEGELVTSFGGKGSAPGNFVGIFLLDSSKELLFAVDSVNGRVQEFNEKGDLVRSFGVFGIEEGDLFRPRE